MNIEIINRGIIDYAVMLNEQRQMFTKMVDLKKQGLPIETEYIILLEHYPTITLGKHAKIGNILLEEEELSRLGIGIYKIERGGDVTYHGPGQIVAYPILDLESHKIGIKKYVEILEEAVIQTLKEFGLKGERVPGASGVWIEAGTANERKICALGVKCSRYITMHGIALNVNINLDGFHMINPCGFKDKGVTSMAMELNKELDINMVKSVLSEKFRMLLGFKQ